jgi:hypothetical protein
MVKIINSIRNTYVDCNSPDYIVDHSDKIDDRTDEVYRYDPSPQKDIPPVLLEWFNITYTVVNEDPGGVPILNGVSGYANPGELIVLMGSSIVRNSNYITNFYYRYIPCNN